MKFCELFPRGRGSTFLFPAMPDSASRGVTGTRRHETRRHGEGTKEIPRPASPCLRVRESPLFTVMSLMQRGFTRLYSTDRLSIFIH